PVVPGSTPVVAFGDPRRATVATLGINPSHREFIENGGLLSGEDRRLATLEPLGADRLDRLTDEQVASVVADCPSYFQRRPYQRWFDPLDRLLQAAPGVATTRAPHGWRLIRSRCKPCAELPRHGSATKEGL